MSNGVVTAADEDELPPEVEAQLARMEAEAQVQPAPIVVREALPADLDRITRIARAMVASKYFQDVPSIAQAAVKIMAGQELGLGPFASMSGIFVVQGRVTLSANVMAGLIKRSGKYTYRVRELDRAHARLEFFQRVDGAWESLGFSEYSVEDAKRAGLYRSGNRGPSAWEAHSDAMCFARALSRGARWHCPDVLTAPIYTPGEIEQEEEPTSSTEQG